MTVGRKRLTSPLAIGAYITAIVTVAGAAYALSQPRQDTSASIQSTSNAWLQAKERSCKTVIFDPHPPINVRATPVEQNGNIIGAIANGTEVSIVLEKEGWYQISAPAAGWIYKKLTKTDCGTPNPVASHVSIPPVVPIQSPTIDPGGRLLEKALSHYQSGNLNGAIALAKAVPIESAAYDQAQVALRTMPQRWKLAESKYTIAVRSLQEGRWSDVLKVATEFPDIRFWRQKLAPIVKEATLIQHVSKADRSRL
ncbi:SH3 domain-containing protein [Myxacorys almedinensis]|uniref:SH3 domain-containing protein n=1 Tax=Myxacorys almedinensis A TaxID=2690445 RepID=A0A8J7Z5T9_9CYAN|nr:SH3 domain-containing protein [Myxacorys almedinensis]NDJ18706.1 SH3 domain-containing protein [Myxacorys almedinensis A]